MYVHKLGVGRDGGVFEEPGEFLPRKTADVGGYLVPSSSRRKSKRDRKKHTLSGKVSPGLVEPLNNGHTPGIL